LPALDLARYSREHRHFAARLPPLLEAGARRGVVADLGCGDGSILAALVRRRLIESSYAVDVSPERVRVAERAAPGTVGVVASAAATGLDDASVDGVVCSQVIEHMPDDRELAPEVARILRPGGWWYVGSVLRRRRAWWLYEVDGVRRLDPTHTREYESLRELLDVLAHPQLQVELTRTSRFRFPVSDLALRAVARAGVISHEQAATMYDRRPILARLRGLAIFPPGYRMIEVAGRRL
jgi:2-polyprenyl-3-methyl-5-hydroxy-6-metoxy-1,4-benzoquinol methylase